MILGRPLTKEERINSQRHYNRFSLINGMGYMCLGESVVTLLALNINMPVEFVAVLGAMVFLGFFLMPLGILRAAKVGAAACQADFWVVRNISALLIASSVLIVRHNEVLAWVTVLAGSLIFYGSRAAGAVLATPLAGDIATEEEVAPLVSKNNGYFYLSATFTIVIIALIMHYFNSLSTIAGVIVFGACVGITSSTVIRKINESGEVRKAAKRNIFRDAMDIFKNKDIINLVLAWLVICFIAICSASLALPAIKEGFGVDNTSALIISSAKFLAAALLAPFVGRLSNIVGPKILISAAFLIYIPLSVLWIFFPTLGSISNIVWYSMAIAAFFLYGTIAIFVDSSLATYFLMLCNDKSKRVSGIIAIQFAGTFCAGILGAVISPLLLRYCESAAVKMGPYFSSGPAGKYRLYFLILIPIITVCFIIVSRMRVLLFDFRAKHGHDMALRVIRIAQTRHRHLLIHK